VTTAKVTLEIGQLRGDLAATTYLLTEVTAERDELRVERDSLRWLLNHANGELAEVRARSYAEPSK